MTYTISPTSTLTTVPSIDFLDEESDAILKDVCKFFNVRKELVMQQCRRAEVKNARWIFWDIMYKRGLTLKQCGQLTGGHDHTSVINALSKLKADMKQDKVIELAYHNLRHYYTDKYSDDTF